MLRWLGILIALALASPADAQVFKPKAKKSATVKKSAKKTQTKAAKKAKKQPRAATPKKRVTKKKAADRDSEDDADSEPKGTDKDYVKIWDDEEIE